MNESKTISKPKAWLLAIRPKTLPAAIVPVVVGSAVAGADGLFVALPAAVALACALLIQIATNLANDYFDFIKGADTEHRLGPTRVVQSGILPPKLVRNVMSLILVVTFILGLYLVSIGGWPILIIGIVSLICAVAYTAGPVPLAYVGLGDVFVFVFFGVVAVTGTYYVQALVWSLSALIASIPIGAVSTAILVVNNYRDIETDRSAGKKTLAVRFGRKLSRTQYIGLLAIAYLTPFVQVIALEGALSLLLPLLSLPLAVQLVKVLTRSTDGEILNHALAGTGRLLALYGLLYSAGFLLPW